MGFAKCASSHCRRSAGSYALGVANDVAAHSVYQLCLQEHPGGLAAVPQGSGRGFFGYSSGAECTAKKAGDTRSQQAAYMISGACRKLYDEPNYFDRYDPPR